MVFTCPIGEGQQNKTQLVVEFYSGLPIPYLLHFGHFWARHLISPVDIKRYPKFERSLDIRLVLVKVLMLPEISRSTLDSI